ncbi:hypothetical protein VNO77_06521 [Canavalia gladiata]|uniref:PGG domain-containing protein n=1 Tax=Canavalia gladiata TaxID=3824 RepID=A0AAN9QVB4_CANGL
MSIEIEAREETKVTVIQTIGDWLAYKNKEEWLKDMRGNLSLVASIIATITFQTAVNPPGGVFQTTTKDDLRRHDNNSTGEVEDICPGEAVLAVVFPDDYQPFLLWNTICFVSSLSVCLLLVSGVPINHRFPTWLLSIGMCITITSLGLTYRQAVLMVTPDPIWGTAKTLYFRLLYVWVALMTLVGFFLVIRLFFWSVRKWNENCNSR